MVIMVQIKFSYLIQFVVVVVIVLVFIVMVVDLDFLLDYCVGLLYLLCQDFVIVINVNFLFQGLVEIGNLKKDLLGVLVLFGMVGQWFVFYIMGLVMVWIIYDEGGLINLYIYCV